jgi:hypothetical protein
VRGDDLLQRFEALETEVLPLVAPPATEAIRRRGRRRQRTIRAAVLASVVLVAAVAARGGARWAAEPDLGPVAPPPTTLPVTVPPTTLAPAVVTTARPVIPTPPITTAPPRPGATVVLRADGLGVAPFGATEAAAMRGLQRRLGPPEERGSWTGATPFGTCPGPVRAARWGRLYVLFSNGPTRYRPAGGWHLFAWQVDALRRTAVDPQYAGPTPPPAPPPLRGYSPRTAAGVGFGSTVTELRAAYGSRVRVSSGTPGNGHRFTVRQGAAGELSGSLSGGTPRATVTGLAAGAVCGE